VSALSGRQRKHLRGVAHALEPLVQVGKGLLTDEVVAQVDRALAGHELIKVRFLEGREAKDELAAELARRTGAELAGRIGHVAILYRPHPDPEQRRIRVPAP
jgi:RNA-binding protein